MNLLRALKLCGWLAVTGLQIRINKRRFVRNILLEIEYDGFKYAGWQVQKNALSIQEILEEKLSNIAGEKIKLIAAGRTDAGVHAEGQAANFKTRSNLNPDIFLKALNAVLPEDICVKKAREVPVDFNARYQAKSKIYRYFIYNSKIKSAFWYKYSWRLPYKLNIGIMKKELKEITGRHNFKSFSASYRKEKSMDRKILKVSLKKKDFFVIIDIEGESFLYNMVRNIVGTLVEIGRGKFPQASMKKILKVKNRKEAGPCAPARGLHLIEVKF